MTVEMVATDQWRRAVERAAAHGIEAYTTDAPDVYVATSHSRPGHAHLVIVDRQRNTIACPCEGGRHELVCRHMGAVAALLGVVGVLVPPQQAELAAGGFGLGHRWQTASQEGHAEGTRTCRGCGCTEEDACVVDDDLDSSCFVPPCHWVEPDLCSACADIEAERGGEGRDDE